jgi:hypothetical protein
MKNVKNVMIKKDILKNVFFVMMDIFYQMIQINKNVLNVLMDVSVVMEVQIIYFVLHVKVVMN